MTTNFYIPRNRIKGDRVTLPDDEARHASRVLRAAAGDTITAVDGEGMWYRIVLEHVGRHSVAGHVVESRKDVGEPGYDLTIAMALVKNRGRFETFLEKAVELGVREIVPLVTERTEKEGLREERSQNILIAAMKQCGRSRLVTLREPQAFGDFMEANVFDLGICCHESAAPENNVIRVLNESGRPRRVGMLIGPEGGFSGGETRRARSAGWKITSLGPRRLRAETAAIAASAAIAFVYDSA